jgi:hypothetical protein
MNKLWKFNWDCGRQGELEGLFIATQEEVDDAIGCEVQFGECLGKHSDVYGTIDDGEITEVEVSQVTLDELHKVFGSTISGYNPLHYIEESEEDDDNE